MGDAFDLVILGGGCAGLSLAMALAAKGGDCPRTLVLESRTEYINDRTWCFWRDRSSPQSVAVQHRWQTMRVANAGQTTTLDCGSTPYNMLAAKDFYAAAQTAINDHPNQMLKLGTSVIAEPTHGDGFWKIRTSSGTVTARSVVDTRPSQLPRRDGATMWQSFYGHEIECAAAVFDPLSLDLMNFLAPDVRDVAFVYVLPVTTTRALVELTVFGATPLTAAELQVRLDAAIAQRVGKAAFSILRSEHGILPMGLIDGPRATDKSHVKVGVMAGGARPSTGYAFQRIQRWADECADALLNTGRPVAHKADPLPLRVMDQIFLDVLRAEPRRGASIFYSLFSGADPARVIRFLSGSAGVVDSLAVVVAMPVFPFLKAAFALTWRRGQIRVDAGDGERKSERVA